MPRVSKAISSLMLSWSNDFTDKQQYDQWLKSSNALWNMEKEDEIKRTILEDSMLKYMKSLEYTPKDIRKIENLKDYDKSTSLLIVGYLLNKGYNYEPAKTYFKNTINKLLKKTYEKPVKIVTSKVVDVTSGLICDIEELENDKLSGKGLPNFEEFLSGKNIDSTTAKKLMAYFKPYYDEYKMGYDGVEEVIEGYSYNKRQFGKICKWYEGLFEALGKYNKVTKTVRKTKPKTPSQIVKGMKYMRKDDDLNITSVKSEEIVGAKAVTLYNVKNRNFYLYVAKDKLSVKGTSIVDFDETLSGSKILRQPNDMLKGLTEGTRTRIMKEYEKLSTKSKSVSGRVNTDMLILSVYRK